MGNLAEWTNNAFIIVGACGALIWWVFWQHSTLKRHQERLDEMDVRYKDLTAKVDDIHTMMIEEFGEIKAELARLSERNK